MSKSTIDKTTGIPKRVQNIIGKRYERLVVKSFIGLDKDSESVWLCKCDCGNIIKARKANLTGKVSKSCGCLQKEIMSKKNTKDISNKRFGKLTAVKNTKVKKNNCYVWDCLCDCGKKVKVTIGSLMSGNTKSCGCVGLERISKLGKSKLLPNNQGAKNALYYKYKKSAIDRSYEFNLSKEEFNNLIKEDCYYCGCKPNKEYVQYRCTSHVTYNGIDRVDNNFGYTTNNCVPCCYICNIMKRSLTQEEFINQAKLIAKKNIKLTNGVIV